MGSERSVCASKVDSQADNGHDATLWLRRCDCKQCERRAVWTGLGEDKWPWRRVPCPSFMRGLWESCIALPPSDCRQLS